MKSARRTFLKDLAKAGLWVPVASAILTMDAQEVVPNRRRNSAGGSSLSAKTLDWASRVVANGDPQPSNATLTIVDTYYQALVAAGVDSLIYWDLITAPGGLITSLTPFFKVFGADPATGTLLTVDASGYILVDQSGHGITSGVNPTNVFTGTSMGLAVYQKNTILGTKSSPAQWGGGGGGRFGYFWTTTLASYAAFQMGFTTPAAFVANAWGFWLGSRTGANQLDVYAANGASPWSNIGSSGAAAAGTVPASGNISYYNNSVATFPYNFTTNNNISYLGIVKGMSTAQGQAYFNAVQAMKQSFGGGSS